MKRECSRNACNNEALWAVAHRINGALYLIPTCAVHRDEPGENV